MPTPTKTALSAREIVVMELLADESLSFDGIARTLGVSRAAVAGRVETARTFYQRSGVFVPDRVSLSAHYQKEKAAL